MKIRELSEKLAKGELTCTQLAEYCLHQIAENDQAGRKLNSTAEISPDVMFDARRIDEELRQNRIRSPLHGIPVLIKDNIDVKGMHTTAGSLALDDLIAEEDAFIVRKLREAGALILGKACLSEFAYFMSSGNMPSGYSSRHGQVVHPYKPGMDPSGSSSGSAVAAAARFVPYTIGTETDGSLLSPACANAVVSIKPTVGLVSRNGILPLSHMQDTAGPLCTSAEDAAAVLQVIVGRDENDAATHICHKKNYMNALRADLTGKRIGIFRGELRDRDARALEAAVRILKEAGAEIIEAQPDSLELDEMECLKYEFKYDLNQYLARRNSRCRSLADIIRYNKEHAGQCLKHGQDLLEASEETSGRLTESGYLKARMELTAKSQELLWGTMDRYNVCCLLSAGRRPVSNLAPVSGSPCMSIPALRPSEENFDPVNYYLAGRPFSEDILLQTAYTLEQALNIECRPAWTEGEDKLF